MQICAMVIKKNRNIIIEQNQLKRNRPTIDWERNTIQLHNIKTIKISAWLEDMNEVFEDLPEGKLPKRKEKFDYTINLITDIFPKTLIILLRPNN